MKTALLLSVAIAGVAAHGSSRPLGSAVVTRGEPTHSVWDSVYTDSQSVRGDSLYKQSCAKCHGAALQGTDDGAALTGDPFFANWDGKSLGALHDIIRISMPSDNPKSLSRSQVSDLVAYLLARNHFPSGATALGSEADRLNDVKIVKRR